LPKAVIDDGPGARFPDGTPLADGLAFGSEYWQSDPRNVVPQDELAKKPDVAETVVADTWLRPFNGRQSRVNQSQANPAKYEYLPVDLGHTMGSPDWTAESLSADRAVDVPNLVHTVDKGNPA